MEILGIGALLIVVAWQLIWLRSEVLSLQQSITIFYSIHSLEKDASGIEEESLHLKKRMTLSVAIFPGMEFAGVANNKPTLVERVVFDSEGLGVHLKPDSASRVEFADTKKWYQSRGWQSAA